MTVDPDRTLRMQRRFAASPERVFDAWVNPETARKWLFTTPVDEAYSAALDVRVGGRWTITARRAGTDYTAIGEYLEIDRPRRLVFTFAMPQFSPDYDRLTIEIVADGSGSLLTLTHEALLPEYHEATKHGWNEMFDLLALVLSS